MARKFKEWELKGLGSDWLLEKGLRGVIMLLQRRVHENERSSRPTLVQRRMEMEVEGRKRILQEYHVGVVE